MLIFFLAVWLVRGQLNQQQHVALQQFFADIGCTNATTCPPDTLVSCPPVLTCTSGLLLRLNLAPLTTNSTLPLSIAQLTALSGL